MKITAKLETQQKKGGKLNERIRTKARRSEESNE